MRVIEIIADPGHLDTIRSIAEQHEVLDIWSAPMAADEARASVRMLVRTEKLQPVLDTLGSALGTRGTPTKATGETDTGGETGAPGARILILPVEASLPPPPALTEEERSRYGGSGLSREELYHNIAAGARLNGSFFLLVVLSTMVASIGLIEDNVAVVIGAMVIAPLLGPNLALALATALGDFGLMWQSLRTNLAGLSLSFVLALLIGFLWPLNLHSHELMSRTDVGLDGVALALASGAAAVLSLSSGLSTTLVGVMVAVALLPPAATMGMMLGAGHTTHALGAGLLLAVNIVCVNLAAKLVFLFRGLRPRSWLEKRKARQSMTLYIVLWLAILAILLGAIYVRQTWHVPAPVSTQE